LRQPRHLGLGTAAAGRISRGALFQTGELFDHLDVRTNIALGLDPRGRPNVAQEKQIEAVLKELGLPGYGPRLPDQLSGGQRQRVALARNLLRDKPLMPLDEPFSALDAEARGEAARLVRDLTHSRQLATMVVSHDPTDAGRRGSREAAMRDGRVCSHPRL
jgi:thiamine transport system ATP-binding protein